MVTYSVQPPSCPAEPVAGSNDLLAQPPECQWLGVFLR
jgi:hypothetical protein